MGLTGVVLAAGKGTRMKSAKSKVCHHVLGRAMISRTVEQLLHTNPEQIIIVVGANSSSAPSVIETIQKDFFDNNPELKNKIFFAEQKEQLGTADAVKSALSGKKINSAHVLVLPGDAPLIRAETLKGLVEQGLSNQITILTGILPDPTGFGRIIRSESGDVYSIIEEKDADDSAKTIREVNSSIYLFERSFLETNLEKIGSQNAQNELYLTDLVKIASDQNLKVQALTAHDFTEILGANHRGELVGLERILKDRVIYYHLLNGVTIQDPISTEIEDTVIIESDCTIGADTRLRGATVIKSGTVIEGSTLINDSVIESNCRIKLFSYIDSSHLKDGCIIGPFAQLRPGTMLEKSVHIGNFVEVKKSHIGEGTKANHLTYLGDAEIGKNTNIGAGTITANYDGLNKHKTIIGDNVSVGSDTIFIAPVNIGSNSATGAGSVINQEIPSGSLGIARERQKNIANWKKRSK